MTDTRFNHQDSWQGLNKLDSIAGKLGYVRNVLRLHMPFISRVAVALYDPPTDYLRTFVYSSDQPSPLNNYQAKLSECHSLVEIARQKSPRVVNDLSAFDDSAHTHTQVILQSGYRSSYTLPMFWEGQLFGFVFFNANEAHVFAEHWLHELDVVGHMITLLVYYEMANIKTLLATLKSALDLSHSRDPETGFHLQRMSHYSRLIARHISAREQFDDVTIEHIFLFAPLHDIGKLAIPDRILLKEGPLTEAEFDLMKTHSVEGKKLIDRLLENFGLTGVTHVEMLRNIALWHHEMLDGEGYPDGLSGQDIPIEARIVAVADVFDALTSKRPYKEAWSNAEAFEHLKELAGIKLDADCVEALLTNKAQVEEIQRIFRETSFA